jgi:hypothetical protein
VRIESRGADSRAPCIRRGTSPTRDKGGSPFCCGVCSLIDGAANSTTRTATVLTSNGTVATPGPLALWPATRSKMICTSNAKIRLTTARGGLTNGTSPTDAHYANKIHYTARATYNGTTETDDHRRHGRRIHDIRNDDRGRRADERGARHLGRREIPRRWCLHRQDHSDADASDVNVPSSNGPLPPTRTASPGAAAGPRLLPLGIRFAFAPV